MLRNEIRILSILDHIRERGIMEGGDTSALIADGMHAQGRADHEFVLGMGASEPAFTHMEDMGINEEVERIIDGAFGYTMFGAGIDEFVRGERLIERTGDIEYEEPHGRVPSVMLLHVFIQSLEQCII